MSNVITVAYITDESYAMPTYISAYSMIRNKEKEDNLRIYLIGNGLSDDSKVNFLLLKKSDVDVQLIEVDSNKYVSLAKTCLFSKTIHVSDTALFKMDLPNILPGEEKVLYIDGDTLIQGSLRELYDTDIKNKYVAAVEEPFDEEIGEYSFFYDRIGLKRKHYFNSGVMLLNLAMLRAHNISEKLLEYRIHGVNYFMDQDCLNAILGERLVLLPCIYNFMSTISDLYDINEIGQKLFGIETTSIESCIAMARILHLTDKKKPWIYNMPWYSDLFFSYYRESPYKIEKIILKSPLKVMGDENKSLRKRMNHIISTIEFVFPYHKIPKGSRIVMYGAGKMGKSFFQQIKATQYCDIVAWVDKKGMSIAKDVALPTRIVDVSYDYILIALSNQQLVDEVRDFLRNTYHVEKTKMISKFYD